MKILVTGSAGFIGSNIINNLLKKNIEIYAIYSSNKPNFYNNKVNLIKQNLYNKINAPICDVVIHCASQCPPQFKNNRSLLLNNLKFIDNLINYAIKTKPKIIIFLSSMSYYGRIESSYVDEDCIINKPDYYGISKIKSEQKLQNLSKKLNNDITCLRLPGVVGKNSKNNFISNLYKSYKNYSDFEIFNYNDYFNNILHVDVLSKFILKKISNYEPGFRSFNLASKYPIKIKNIVKYFNKKLFNNDKLIWPKNRNKKSFLINYKKIKLYGYKDISVKKSLILFLKDNSEKN